MRVRAERLARHHRHVLRSQQPLGELAALRDAWRPSATPTFGIRVERALRLGARDAGDGRSRVNTKSRRRRYSASIAATESCGPRSASTAAFCAIEVGFEVVWLCSLVMAASITGAGASAKPMRHPVMA